MTTENQQQSIRVPGQHHGADLQQDRVSAPRSDDSLLDDGLSDSATDPWTAFATAVEPAPGRIRRAWHEMRRLLIHEVAVASYGSLLLAIVLAWPTLRDPRHTLPLGGGEPSQQAWQVAWNGHVLRTNPAHWWQSNAFYPHGKTFAIGDSLLGYAPAGLLGAGPTAAILRYNLLLVLAQALLAFGAYALIRQLGSGRTGATVGAVAFAYAPWHLAQSGQLDLVSAGGVPLALALLARGHGWSLRPSYRRDQPDKLAGGPPRSQRDQPDGSAGGLPVANRRVGWAVLGWLVAAWQVSLGFSLGLPFLYVLALVLVLLFVRLAVRLARKPLRRPKLAWPLLLTDTLGPLFVGVVAAWLVGPYLRDHIGGSSGAEIAAASPPLRSFLIGPAESLLWGSAHAGPRSALDWPAGMALLPGFVLYALALTGLAFSLWTLRQRLALLAALAATVILTLGTHIFGGRWTYLPLFGHFPAGLGVRVPGRLMLWSTLLLAVLAAGAVTEFVRRAEHLSANRVPPWPGPWLRAATFVPLVLVLVEGLGTTAHPAVPAQPAAMRAATGPLLVLPSAELTDPSVVLWSTSNFAPVANGSGSFAAARQDDLRRAVAAFPDQASVDYLRAAQIRTVLLLRTQAVGTPWERANDLPIDNLGLTREDLDDSVLFRLS